MVTINYIGFTIEKSMVLYLKQQKYDRIFIFFISYYKLYLDIVLVCYRSHISKLYNPRLVIVRFLKTYGTFNN